MKNNKNEDKRVKNDENDESKRLESEVFRIK